jgi:Fic-DOC domain mobile mystery protein B
MEFQYAPGATPLDPDEAAGLVPSHITTQGDLNAWEQANILLAERWVARQIKRDLLNEGFVRDLHRRMFDKTWRWAGTFRQSNKNIGVDWTQVAVKLRNLLDNTRFQIDHKVFEPDELVVRFHHQLVWVHAFPNGNGRHARLMADVLAQQLGRPRMTWGGADVELVSMGTVRDRYLRALREADQGQWSALIAFARS